MPSLILQNNQASNPLTLDVSQFLNLTEGSGFDPAAPAFQSRIWSRSVLREGSTLAMEALSERELVFPLLLNAANTPALTTLVEQINQCIETPGSTATWKDDGATQATIFDGLSGVLEVQYSYRKAAQQWMSATLRYFSMPLGRTAGPRLYAAASGVGPLLMISPYASGGALAIGASTQAGVAGFGGRQQGASSGVFYSGAPSLAGDAPALMQISYVGPLPTNASGAGTVPYVAVSILPDPLYRPLITVPEIAHDSHSVTISNSAAVAGQYITLAASGPYGVKNSPSSAWSFAPLPVASYSLQEPTVNWAGNHRLLAIARASIQTGYLQTVGNSLVQTVAAASVNPGDWGLYDLGTFSIRPSEMPQSPVSIIAVAGATGAIDTTALVMLPDNATWFLNPTGIQASQYGYPPEQAGPGAPSSPYTNTFILDDVLGDQFVYSGQSQTFAPSPSGSVPSSSRITSFTRGLVPRPDPKNGLPILAILGVGQSFSPSASVTQKDFTVGGSWPNPQNQRSMAQVNVVERARWVLP